MKRVVKSLEDLEQFATDAALKGLLTGQAMTVTLTKFRRPRTTDQNSKLHVLFRELAEHTGYSETEIKDFMKSEYGPKKQITMKVRNTGDVKERTRTVPKGTSEYTVNELADMIERVYQVGALAGCEFQERPE